MKIIDSDNKLENVVNKSKFICILKYVDNIDSVNKILLNLKKEYKGANHYCYSYIINNSIKYFDDGEPKGSAGLPIYKAINNHKLNNILCVVIRYFGGVKLGLGPLTRAYFNSTNDCVKDTKIIEYVEYKKITIVFSYDIVEEIDFLTQDFVVDKNYNEKIQYELSIPIKNYQDLKIQLNKYNIKIDE